MLIFFLIPYNFLYATNRPTSPKLQHRYVKIKVSPIPILCVHEFASNNVPACDFLLAELLNFRITFRIQFDKLHLSH